MDLTALRGKVFLITGADGMLGRAFHEVLSKEATDCVVHAASHATLDVRDRNAVMRYQRCRPDFVLHCAASVDADWCERHRDECQRTNVLGTANVVDLAVQCRARIFYPQSVFIFDGRELPVDETTVPAPTFAYGRYKLAAERLILDRMPRALVIRMAGFFGGDEKDKNFVGKFATELRTMLAERCRRCVVGQRVWQPSYTIDLARNALLLMARDCGGIYHMGSIGEASFFDVAAQMVEELGLGGLMEVAPGKVVLDEPARRPGRMVTSTIRLDREGLNLQRGWREALHEYLLRPCFNDLRGLG